MTTSDRAWDDPKWLVKTDDTWTAGCRWLQARWRAAQGWPAGPRKPGDERLVVSMLNEGCDEFATFFDRTIFGVVEEHLDAIGYGAANALDQLLRNLLSTRALVFNLFGSFVGRRHALLPWVRTIDATATSVEDLRLDWAPKKSAQTPPGVTFDVAVVYRAGDSTRLLGVTCKYAEDSDQKTRPAHTELTVASGHWRDDAARRLDAAVTRHAWLATLLAQAAVESDAEFADVRVVAVTCATDLDATTAIGAVRAELLEPDRWLTWCALEQIVDVLEATAPEGWGAWFDARYLDFSPVAHLLDPRDPRLTGAQSTGVDAFARLLAAGQGVLGDAGVVKQLVSGTRVLRNAIDGAGLSQRAASLADDLDALRQAISDASS
ncbi:MAG TPA: hypothetical protein VMZ22_08395 [Acidimicrobiales bacterium]|nr:hypothetical protein [Acidimicrobiales bacterium]